MKEAPEFHKILNLISTDTSRTRVHESLLQQLHFEQSARAPYPVAPDFSTQCTHPWFNSNLRTLSEMPLCEALSKSQFQSFLTQQCGLRVVKGTVTVIPPQQEVRPHYRFTGIDHVAEYTGGSMYTHYFAIDPTERIYCFTAGQFIEMTTDLPKGERANILQSLAPDLIYPLTDEVLLLSGESRTIQERLNLVYDLSNLHYY